MKYSPKEMTNTAYHSADGISSSNFSLLAESPLHLQNKELFSLDGKPSLGLGSAVHKLILEPDTFDQEFAIVPDLPKNTKAGKDAYAEFLETLEERTILTSSEYDQAHKMARNVRVIAGGLLQSGEAEQSYFAKDENGIIRKCRPDYYIQKSGILIDIKTTRDGMDYGFAKSIAEYRYDRQAAWYIDTLTLLGLPAKRFVFITVEKTSPYMVRVRELDAASIEKGRANYQQLLKEYIAFLETGRAQIVKEISLPEWAS